MSSFSYREYADIVFFYGLANGSASRARALYQERFPTRRIPNAQVFRNTFQRLGETGNLNFREPRVSTSQHRVEVDDMILEAFRTDPTTSVRKVVKQLNDEHQLRVSTFKVWSVVHADLKHPFHYTPVQGLEAGDPARRLVFCRYILNQDIEDENFLKRILWTDESKFDKNGITNFHNEHYWETKGANPKLKKQVSSQRRFSVNVWAGVIGGFFIGPHYLPDNLNGAMYLQFLQNNLSNLLEDVPLNLISNMLYQHDGCPAHYSSNVKQYLDANYENRWIGRNGPVLWPARSPDLTPLDFYVWGRLKGLVYVKEPINSREQLINKINDACEILKGEMRLGITTTEVRRRARACVRNGGAHFEHQ